MMTLEIKTSAQECVDLIKMLDAFYDVQMFCNKSLAGRQELLISEGEVGVFQLA